METWSVLLADVDKRDKIYRTIQYLCKLYCGLPYGSAETKLGVRKLAKVLSSARQVLRLGKSFLVWNKIRSQPKMVDPISFSLIRLSDFSFMLYFLCDNIAWLFRSGLIVGKEKGPRRKATEFYLSGAAFNLLENTRQLLKIVFMERHYSSSEHSQNEMMGEQHFSAQMKHDRIWKQRLYLTICICIRLILDIIVALNILRDDSKDTIFNGICGSLSSIIAFYISWPVKKSISSE